MPGRIASRVALLLLAVAAAVVLPRAVLGQALATFDSPRIVSSSHPHLKPFDSPLPTWQIGPQTTFHIRGRVDTDFITTSQSPANEATFGDLGGVVGLRRARIGAEGNLPNGHYITEIDLASGEVVVRDVFLALGHLKETGEYRGGHFREPFSLEGGTSANTFAFLERSPINVLDPARNWGLAFFRADLNDAASIAAGAFHAGTDAGDFQGGDGSTVGFTQRLLVAPLHDEDSKRLIHAGIALSERIPDNGVVIINQQPQSPLLDLGDSSTSPFIPAITIPATYQQLMNLQVAVANRSLWAQAEWYGTWIAQTGDDTVFFHGSYVACGWFITGEHRAYPGPNGGLGAVKVQRPFLRGPAGRDKEHGWGAWELTSRFSYLDFFDPNTPTGPESQLIGIELPESTFGVNWYLADHVRLMFNYTYAVPNEPNTGASVANDYSMRLGIFW